MTEGIETFSGAGLDSADKAADVISQLFKIAEPGVVFSEPVKEGDYTVITASEISVGMGLGFGVGGGKDDEGEMGGGSGGGGGASAGRPVAAVIIGPNGVRIEPIVDPTKIAIAFFTTLGAMFMAWRGMRGRGKLSHTQ